MSFALPESLRAYIDERVQSGQYGNASEYLRDLVRRDQDDQAKKRLRDLIRQAWNRALDARSIAASLLSCETGPWARLRDPSTAATIGRG